MQKRVLALFLLAAFGFGLLAGPHPCSALQGGEPDRPSTSSCHGVAGEEAGNGAHANASLPPGDHDSDDCCDAFCGHACQMTAVFENEPALFSIPSVSPVLAAAPGRGLPLFTHPIDHVPLA